MRSRGAGSEEEEVEGGEDAERHLSVTQALDTRWKTRATLDGRNSPPEFLTASALKPSSPSVIPPSSLSPHTATLRVSAVSSLTGGLSASRRVCKSVSGGQRFR